MKYPVFENVVSSDGKVWNRQNAMFDSNYYSSFFSELKRIWPAFDEYIFVVHSLAPLAPTPDFTIKGPNVILIITSDQSGRTFDRAFRRQFFAVIRTHLQTDGAVDNLLPFPLGDSIATENIVPPSFEKRTWDAGFIGCLNNNRIDLFRSMTPLKLLPPWPLKSAFTKKVYGRILHLFSSRRTHDFKQFDKLYFTFTSGFAKGLPPDEYGRLLADTKIVICPKGFIRAECYRIFEAMRLGSIIIADELPEQPWYIGSPIIIQKNWLKIHDTIRALQNAPDKMREIHHDTLTWWETVCSPQAVAHYMLGKFMELTKNTH